MNTTVPVAAPRFPRREHVVTGGLLLLSVVPVLAGLYRLSLMATSATIDDNARFLADPLPAIGHVAGGVVFLLLGTLQLSPTLRRRWPLWHRRAGAVLVVLSAVAAASGLKMVMTWAPIADDGPALYVIRVFFGGCWLAFTLLGVEALRRRDWAGHGAHMLRAYAIALGAGTQVFTHLPYFVVEGLQNEAGRALAMTSGWVLNLVVCELSLRRGPATSPRPVPPAVFAARTT